MKVLYLYCEHTGTMLLCSGFFPRWIEALSLPVVAVMYGMLPSQCVQLTSSEYGQVESGPTYSSLRDSMCLIGEAPTKMLRETMVRGELK